VPTAYLDYLSVLMISEQFLFTGGMTLVDSCDSMLMLYSYAGFVESKNGFALFHKRVAPPPSASPTEPPRSETAAVDIPIDEAPSAPERTEPVSGRKIDDCEDNAQAASFVSAPLPGAAGSSIPHIQPVDVKEDLADDSNETMLLKRNTMSGLSIILTLISILISFR
jgi:high-affinity nickel-transport protein